METRDEHNDAWPVPPAIVGVLEHRQIMFGLLTFATTSVVLPPCPHARRNPVTVVRPAGGRDETSPVVVGVDLDGTAGAALEVGFRLASMSGRPLEAIHAWATEDNVITELTDKQQAVVTEKHERGFAEAMAGCSEKYPDVPVTTRMTEEPAPVALVSASERPAQVVVGGRAPRRVPRYFGLVGRTVVEHAHCRVTVIRPQPMRPEEDDS